MITAKDFHTRHVAHLVVDMQEESLDDLHPADCNLPDRITAFIAASDHHILPIHIETEIFGPSVVCGRTRTGTTPERVQKNMMNSGFCYKQCGDILIPSDLDHILRRNHIDTVVISGLNRRICVWETALDAVRHGYHTSLIDDLCLDTMNLRRSKNWDEVTPQRAAENGIHMISAAALLVTLPPTPAGTAITHPQLRP